MNTHDFNAFLVFFTSSIATGTHFKDLYLTSFSIIQCFKYNISSLPICDWLGSPHLWLAHLYQLMTASLSYVIGSSLPSVIDSSFPIVIGSSLSICDWLIFPQLWLVHLSPSVIGSSLPVCDWFNHSSLTYCCSHSIFTPRFFIMLPLTSKVDH